MREIEPSTAARLAGGAYAAQSERTLEVFLEDPVFCQTRGGAQQLKAEVGFRIINAKDGFGVCVRGGKGREKETFIMFRGTTLSNYGADLISDARIGVEKSKTGLPVHIGFNHAFCSMLPSIREFLNKNADATGTIHVIGHSLGGAVAAIAADWLSTQRRPVKLYTFGAPKPGFEFFADKLTTRVGANNIYRIYHATDVVPMVPVYPFTHSPTNNLGYQLPSNSFISFAAHKMANYGKSVKDRSWGALKNVGDNTTYHHSIEHWINSDRPLNPADPKTWEWVNAGLTWVLRRVIGSAAVYLQSPITSGFSLADKIAWILRKGIDLSVEASGWVLKLMGRIMQALGMKLVKEISELTRQFMRNILVRLIGRMSAEAIRAIRGLIQNS
jgi:triacylglycerol lipase